MCEKMADLGALQRLQQGLRGELSCDWPQVQPLQLVQHSINIAPCRFIGKQLTFDRLIGQHVEKTSARTNMIEEVKKEHCFAACVPGTGKLQTPSRLALVLSRFNSFHESWLSWEIPAWALLG